MKKQSIRRGVWRIGGRRRQRGGFFPIGALAGPIIGGIASNLAGPLFKKLSVAKEGVEDEDNYGTRQYFTKATTRTKKSSTVECFLPSTKEFLV